MIHKTNMSIPTIEEKINYILWLEEVVSAPDAPEVLAHRVSAMLENVLTGNPDTINQ